MAGQTRGIKRGEPLRADWLSRIAAGAVQRITVIGGKVSRVGNDVVIESDKTARGGASPSNISRMVVKSVQYNHLVCRAYVDGVLGTEDINVAKPHELRQSPWTSGAYRGVYYELTSPQDRIVMDESEDILEEQVIVPQYLVEADGPIGFKGSEIYALQADTTISGTDYEWVDLNVGARAWAKVYEGDE